MDHPLAAVLVGGSRLKEASSTAASRRILSGRSVSAGKCKVSSVSPVKVEMSAACAHTPPPQREVSESWRERAARGGCLVGGACARSDASAGHGAGARPGLDMGVATAGLGVRSRTLAGSLAQAGLLLLA